jgi:diguanylate cyclase (GGDEF)-like protein
MVSCSFEQLLQTNISVINTLEPEEIAALMTKAKSNTKSSFDFRHRLASGEIRDVEVFSVPLKFNGQQALFSVVNDVTERKHLEQQLQIMATTDTLTGLPNRRHFLERLQEQFNLLARGASQCASLMMLDLDHFKTVNDTWGHAAGDQVLQQLAGIMREQLRKVDIPGRIGGEEFAILLPGIGPQEARASAERLRLALAGSPRILSDGTQIQQTISIGISQLLDTDLDTMHPLARADKALYQAKAQGRNRTVVASEGVS